MFTLTVDRQRVNLLIIQPQLCQIINIESLLYIIIKVNILIMYLDIFWKYDARYKFS